MKKILMVTLFFVLSLCALKQTEASILTDCIPNAGHTIARGVITIGRGVTYSTYFVGEVTKYAVITTTYLTITAEALAVTAMVGAVELITGITYCVAKFIEETPKFIWNNKTATILLTIGAYAGYVAMITGLDYHAACTLVMQHKDLIAANATTIWTALKTDAIWLKEFTRTLFMHKQLEIPAITPITATTGISGCC